jgi:hypothetical protein
MTPRVNASSTVSPAPAARGRKVGRWLVRGLVAVLALAALAGIIVWQWIRIAPTESDTEHAVALFTEVMNGDSEREPEALSALAGAMENDPRDGRAALWFGLANLNGLLRHGELPYAIRASMAFERAVELDPSNHSAEGWRAFFAYQAAERRELDLEGPRRELLAAAEGDPGFTVFLSAIALADYPLASGVPQTLLDPLIAAGDCGDGTTTSCRASPLFPHGAEGYHATLGDLRIRLGDLEGGRREYAAALAVPAAASWPYRDAFQSWVEGADARAATFTDTDEANDARPIFFATGDRACATCHRSD